MRYETFDPAWLRILVLTLVPSLSFPGSAHAERPLFTEEAETLEPGYFSLDLGFGAREEPRDFGIADRDRELELGNLRLSFGLGKVAELQFSGTIQLWSEVDGESSTNSGDYVFGTKVWLLQERRGGRPSFSFLYEVKLPNASDEDGGATDETDFFGFLVVSKQLEERLTFHGNLGLGILGNPFESSSQNDIYLLRLALERQIGEDLRLAFELINEGGPAREDDPTSVRLTVAKKLDRWVLYAGGGLGLTDDADEAEVRLGVRRRYPLWRSSEAVVRRPW